MHKSGFKKVFDPVLKKQIRLNKTASSIPLILRDMGPRRDSLFDPRIAWEQEKPLYLARMSGAVAKKKEEPQSAAAKKASSRVKAVKLSKSDMIKLNNSKRMEKKVHGKDIEKMKSNNSLESLQNAKVDTEVGKLQRMLKMLHMAVTDYKAGKQSACLEVRAS